MCKIRFAHPFQSKLKSIRRYQTAHFITILRIFLSKGSIFNRQSKPEFCTTFAKAKIADMKNKKTLVLGASANPSRYSNMAINRLVSYDQPVVAVGLKEAEVAGVKIQTKQVPFTNVDTVTLYLNPQRQKEYYNYITGLQPKRVIFNPGTENPELYQLLKANGVKVEVACTLVMLSTGQY